MLTNVRTKRAQARAGESIALFAADFDEPDEFISGHSKHCRRSGEVRLRE
jgi:hypothetical protein